MCGTGPWGTEGERRGCARAAPAVPAWPSPGPPTLIMDSLGHRCPCARAELPGTCRFQQGPGAAAHLPTPLPGRQDARSHAWPSGAPTTPGPEQQEEEISGECGAQSHSALSPRGQATPGPHRTTAGTGASPELLVHPGLEERWDTGIFPHHRRKDPGAALPQHGAKPRRHKPQPAAPGVPTGRTLPSGRPQACKRGECPWPSPPTAPLVTAHGERWRSAVSRAAASPLQGSQALPGVCQPNSRAQAQQGRRGRSCLALAGAAVPGRRRCTERPGQSTTTCQDQGGNALRGPGDSPLESRLETDSARVPTQDPPRLAPPRAVPRQRDQAPAALWLEQHTSFPAGSRSPAGSRRAAR